MKYKLTVVFVMDVPQESYDFSTHDTEQTLDEFILEIEREQINSMGIGEYVGDVAVAFPVESWTLVAAEPVAE